MQSARIRTGWKNRKKEISIEEFANALSAICWRISLNAAKNLHQQDFIYNNDTQRIGVIQAYLHFFIHCTDRLMFESLDHTARNEFITALSRECRRHYIENTKEILGRSAITDTHSKLFFDELNRTANAFSKLRFHENAPSYKMYQLLGSSVQNIMGASQTNKWVIDQVMDIDGPEAYEIFKKAFDKLKRGAGY